MKFDLGFVAAVVIIVVTGFAVGNHHKVAAPTTVQTAISTNYCGDNAVPQKIIVSIKSRKMWACAARKTVYSNPVVTGMQMYPEDLTPPGTYQISNKLTNQDLTGTDNTGSWNDPVSYWLPFLQNQNGVYGFHDATWRKDSDFGNIDPNSKNASHGCVEMPLAAAKWLFGWAQVGTTVVIES